MTKSPRSVIGLKYNALNKQDSPKVIAKGHGDIAQEILQLAEQHGILIHEDAQLTELLSTLDLGQEIPESLYFVIAELIAYSYILQGKVPAGWEDTVQGLHHLV